VSRILLLLPSAAYRADAFLDAIATLGIDVVVGSDHDQALAAEMGDRALTLDFGEPAAAVQAILGFARRTPLDAVVPVDDRGVLIAALAAEELDLRHNPSEAAAGSVHKSRMRAMFDDAGVAQPQYRVLRERDDPAKVAAEVGFPVVIKPESLSMSRGVLRADTPDEARAAGDRVRRILAGTRGGSRVILVEAFVPGDEFALEGLLRGGALDVLALFDKPDPLEGPTFEEGLYVTPSRHPGRDQEEIRHLVADGCRALGLREGPIHAEIRLSPDGPKILEVAARSIGGLCSRALRFGAGVSLEELILRHALGLPLDDTREEAASGVMMLPVPSRGRLQEVRGVEKAEAVPGIEGVSITVHPGDRLVPLPEGDRYLGFVFARGEKPAEVESALREADRLLEPVIVGA